VGRLKGCLWLVAGLVVAAIAGFVAYTTLENASAQRAEGEALLPTVTVVTAIRPVEIRSALAADDLRLTEVAVDAVPEGAVRTVEEAVGKITLVELYPGEAILAQRLLDPNLVTRDGRKALVLAEDQVLMAFPVDDLMSRMNVLKPGDHVDLLISMDIPREKIEELQTVASETGEKTTVVVEAGEEEEQVTFDLMQNVTVASIIGGERREDGSITPPQALLLTVAPQDALVLKYALDAGAVFDLVLRAPGMEGPYDVAPVDLDYLIDLHELPTVAD